MCAHMKAKNLKKKKEEEKAPNGQIKTRKKYEPMQERKESIAEFLFNLV